MKKTANEKLRDSLIQHRIYVINYSDGLSDQAVKLLKDSEDELEKIITFYANKLQGARISTAANRKVLRKMNNDIKQARSVAWGSISNSLKKEIVDFSYEEASYVTELFQEILPVKANVKKPTKLKLRESVLNAPYDGQVLGEWLDTSQTSDLTVINKRFRQSVKDGLSTDDIVKSVVGTVSRKRKDGVMRRAWAGQEALALTSTISAQTETMRNVLDENTWMVTHERFSAILDGATTAICQQNDAQIFKLNEGPFPPLHFRCRSLRVPHIIPQSITNRPTKPFVQTEIINDYAKANNLGKIKNRASLPYGHKTKYDAFERDALHGLIGSEADITEYTDWLRNQSHEFQAFALKSKKRAELFRKEGLHIREYVNQRTGQYLTLNELMQMGRL